MPKRIIPALLFAMLLSPTALAQTWTGGRSTPNLSEIVAIDTTGEPGWLFGQEDLAGDGTIFQQPEQGIDLRTAYAGTTAQELWVRSYVSSTAAPGNDLSVYVFIDADQSAASGGPASATNVHPAFTSDPSAGGYEWVLGLGGDESVVGLWEWDGASFATASFNPNQIAVEVDADLDPIRINENNHGYVQGRIELTLVGVAQACAANLYVRSTNDDAALGAGDLDVGQAGACVPADGNGNDIPDPLEPGNCSNDDQCPGDGVCVNGDCVIAVPCTDASDCAANYECTPDGRCVPEPSGSCTDDDECGEQVCSGGQCVACALGGSDCGSGRKCAPDGRCVADSPGSGGAAGSSGITPSGEQEVQGGACVCGTPNKGSSSSALALLVLPFAIVLRRIRRRSPR